jgi:hypothetical protein
MSLDLPPTTEFTDLADEMAIRRAEIRRRLGLPAVSSADTECPPSACASCASSCHPRPEVGLPLAESYEAC